jgi:hypothetical protein
MRTNRRRLIAASVCAATLLFAVPLSAQATADDRIGADVFAAFGHSLQLEAHTTNPFWRASLRILFNPSRTLENTAMGRPPWHRNERRLNWR